MIISCTSTSANATFSAPELVARKRVGRQRAEHQLHDQDHATSSVVFRK